MAEVLRYRDDETVDHPAVTVDSFLDQSNASAVRVEPGDDARDLIPHLGRLALVEVNFPAFGDGRGFSSARILREAGYAGELRAVGDVLVDQVAYMRRCGFDAFEPDAPLDQADLETALARWPEVYQPAADTRADLGETARMNELRAIDRIDVGPRFTDQDAIRLNRMFRGSETEEWLRAIVEGSLAGDLALVSSFGAESAVLLHLVSRIDPRIPVLFLETGKHFPETLAYRDELTELLGLNRIDLYPKLADLQARDETGLRWSYDPDGCCELRKVRPLEKALARFDASITGRKAFQSSSRTNLPRFEIDNSDAQGRFKINPLIDWDAARIAAYFAEHDLPRHPLVERGFASIGCSPCTRAVKPGEDARAGRWSGWDKVECGIHRPGEEPFL